MPVLAALPAIAGVVGAGAGIAGQIGAANQRKQQAGALNDLISQAQANPEGIFGSKPEFTPVDYQPLYQSDPGYRQIVADVLAGDQANLPAASQLSGDISKAVSRQMMERIKGWDPSFLASMNTLYNTRNQTLQGHLPYSDALDIAGDRGRMANDLGYSGGAGPQIAKDLGLKRLDLMTNTGPQLANTIQNILGQVDPVARHPVPQDYLLYPHDAVPWAIQENQFGATFGLQQNLETAAFNAMPDPAAQGLFNLQAFQAGIGGGGGNNAGGILQGLAGGIAGLSRLGQGGGFGGFGGGYGSYGAGQYPYVPNAPQAGGSYFGSGSPNLYIQPGGQATQYIGNHGYPGWFNVPSATPVYP